MRWPPERAVSRRPADDNRGYIQIFELKLIAGRAKRDAINHRHADELVIVEHAHKCAAAIETGVKRGRIVLDLAGRPAM
jgi:hypothetical protein